MPVRMPTPIGMPVPTGIPMPTISPTPLRQALLPHPFHGARSVQTHRCHPSPPLSIHLFLIPAGPSLVFQKQQGQRRQLLEMAARLFPLPRCSSGPASLPRTVQLCFASPL